MLVAKNLSATSPPPFPKFSNQYDYTLLQKVQSETLRQVH